MPLLSSSLNDVSKIAILPEKARRLANLFWPGALTLVLKSKIKFNMHLMNNKGEVGFRVPNNLFARNLASELGGIIVGTSANLSGQPAASTLMEALKQIGSKVDFAIDGGKLPGTPSTVVRFERNNVKFIREGAISIQKIIKAIED
jgi:L-threonylcarbamoyladenylate synthase